MKIPQQHRTWRASRPDFNEDIRFAPEALIHLQQHRQTRFLASEAGGQLFGREIDSGLLVLAATGPYRGDKRTRTSYRSNPSSADQAIIDMRERGLFYLGEWHTHPEAHPRPSSSDVNAFIRLCENSTFAVSAPILLIQGQDTSLKGLSVTTLDGARLISWELGECPEETVEEILPDRIVEQ